MKRSSQLVAGLAVAWLLWSGHYSTEPLIFTFGVLSVALVLWLSRRMERAASRVAEPLAEPESGFLLRFLAYLPWLLAEIVKANLHVARIILRPSMPIAPRLLRVEASQRTEVCQVLHANSITLTPGTVTLDLRDGELLVHALDESSARGVEEGSMNARVTRVEGGS